MLTNEDRRLIVEVLRAHEADELADKFQDDVAALWEKLARPFPESEVGKKPGWNTADRAKTAPWVDKCPDCGRGHKRADYHLDYIGHPHVVDRLNEVDPEWTWEPLAYDTNGLPLLTKADGSGGLWGKLTVLGVTRIEFGEGRTVKACMSDVLKRCAMRFGVASEMWTKEDRVAGPTADEGDAPATDKPATVSQAAPPAEVAPPRPWATMRALNDAGFDVATWGALLKEWGPRRARLAVDHPDRADALADLSRTLELVWPWNHDQFAQMVDALAYAESHDPPYLDLAAIDQWAQEQAAAPPAG